MAEPHAPNGARRRRRATPRRTRAALAHALAVPLAFAALFALFFSPVVFGGRLLAPGDATHFFVPNFYSPRSWWDALVWAGTPRFADPSAMFWYPPQLVCRLLPQGWNLFALSSYVVAASTTYGYVFRLTRSCLAAAVSGTTYALSGFMIVHAGHTSMIHTAAWLPLVVWSLEELRRAAGRRARAWFAAGALSVALSALAGHPQIFLYTLATGGALSVCRARGARQGRLRYLATCAALVALGCALAALQLVPTAELARLTPRAALGFEAFNAYQLPLRQLPTFVFPLVYGGAPHSFYQLPYFGAWGSEGGGWNASEVTGYAGLLPLLLAAFSFNSPRHRRLALAWLVVASVALLLALGDNAPLAYVTYRLPLFNKFRAPARHLCEFSFAASVLAGLGVSAIRRGAVARRQIARVVACAFAVALACLAALALYRGQFDAQARAVLGHGVGLAPWRNPATLVPLVVLAAACAALIFWSRRTSSRARSVALFVVLVCDLGSLAWFSEWRGASPAWDELAPPPVAARVRDALAATGQRALAVRGGLGANEEIPPEQSRLWHVRSAGGYGPLMLSRMSRLLSMLPHGAVAENWAADSDRALDVTAVRYVTTPRTDADDNSSNDKSSNNNTSSSDTTSVGAKWGDDLNVTLGRGCNAAREGLSFTLDAPARATHVALVTQLACSDQIADGAHVLSVTLTDAAGRASELTLAAGRDTSEWAYDCADVRPHVRHTRARVFTTFATERAGGPCAGHDYETEIALAAPSDVKTVALRWAGGDFGSVSIRKLTFVDQERDTSRPVNAQAVALGDATRWRLAEEAGAARVYENLRARPRAWLVNDVVTTAPDAALAAVKTSRLPDGRAFDPIRTALVEEPQDFSISNAATRDQSSGAATDDARGGARIVAETDAALEVRTESASAAFLVVSEAYYPGWRARVDGREAHVFQTDYALRGVAVPAGAHVVRFELRPRSFRVGLAVSVCALVALAVFVSKINPIWKSRARRGTDRRVRPSRRAADAVASLLEGRYAEKSRRARVLLSSLVALYPFAYLANMVVRVDGRYTGIDNDFGYCYYEYTRYYLDALSRLRFLLWSPAEGAGYPFYSCPFPAVFYPLNLLLAVFYRLAGGYAQYDHQLYTISAVALFAVGLFHWLRLFPFNLRAVLFATLVMCVSFKVTETMRFPNSSQTAAWYPWILFLLTQIMCSPTTRRAVKLGLLLFAVLVCHLTAGYPYFNYYTLFLAAPYLAVFVVPRLRRTLWRQPVGNLKVALSVIAVASASALALCAPYLVQVGRLLKQTWNRGGGLDYATEHEFRPLHTLAALVFPPTSQPEGWYYFGMAGLLVVALYLFTKRDDASGANFEETDGARVGNVKIDATDGTRVVESRAGGAAWFADRRIKIFFLAWIAVVSYITYGRRSYLFLLLFKLAPFFSSLRVWGRLNIVLVPVLAWLLAHAYASFERLVFARAGERQSAARRRAIDRQLILLAACYSAALAAQLYFLRRELYDFYWSRLGDFAHLRGREPQFVLSGFVAFAALACVLLLARARRLDSKLAPAAVLSALLLVTVFDTRPVGARQWTYTAAMAERRRRDVDAEIRNSFDTPRTDLKEQLPTAPAFNVGNVERWYFARYAAFYERAAREPEAKRRLLGVEDGRKVFLSRAVDQQTIADFLADSASFGGASRVVAYTGDELALEVEAPAEGFVSFIDNWDEDWRASVDGRPAELSQLFGTFKSVRVPEGQHRVNFSYRPPLFGWLATRR